MLPSQNIASISSVFQFFFLNLQGFGVHLPQAPSSPVPPALTMTVVHRIETYVSSWIKNVDSGTLSLNKINEIIHEVQVFQKGRRNLKRCYTCFEIYLKIFHIKIPSDSCGLQNFNSFISFRQLLFSFIWLSWNFLSFHEFFFSNKCWKFQLFFLKDFLEKKFYS